MRLVNGCATIWTCLRFFTNFTRSGLTHRDYVCHTHCSQFRVLPLLLILEYLSQLDCLLFLSRPPRSTSTSASAFRTSAPLHARSYTRHPCTLAFALAPPPRPRIAPNPLLVVRQMLAFGLVGTFAPLTAQPRPRTPRTAPALRLRRTVTSRPARLHAH
jgi:hypothetical protein